jgi:hypothetical protein
LLLVLGPCYYPRCGSCPVLATVGIINQSIKQSIKQQQQKKTSTVAAEQIRSDFSSTTRQTAASCSSFSFFFLFLFLQFLSNNRRREMLCCCCCRRYWIFFSNFVFLVWLFADCRRRQTDGHKGHRHDNAHARPPARAEGVA